MQFIDMDAQGLRWTMPESTAVQTYAYNDMVEAIRCQACSHLAPTVDPTGFPFCNVLGITVTPDFYCGYGTYDFIVDAEPIHVEPMHVDLPEIQEQLDQNISDVDSLLA